MDLHGALRVIQGLLLKQLSSLNVSESEKKRLFNEIASINDRLLKIEQELSEKRYPERFNILIKKVFEFEGYWSDAKSDPGGTTMYGISSTHNPEVADKIRSKTLTLEEAKEIYFKKYYSTIYSVHKLPIGIAFVVFDAKVHGSYESIIDLQKWLKDNVCPKIAVDGIFGRETGTCVLGIDSSETQTLLNHISDRGVIAAKSAAARVLGYQKKNGLEEYDYTRGFVNRLQHRYAYAVSIQSTYNV